MPPAAEPPPLRLHLFERDAALVNVALVAALAFAAALLAPPPFVPRVLALGALAALLAAGERVRVTVSNAGVELVRLRAWLVPARPQRYRLDVEVDRYQSFEADEPEGLCLRPGRPWWPGERESECFGLAGPGLEPLRERVVAALAAFRASAPTAPEGLRSDVLAPHAGAFDLARAERNAQGRLVALRCVAPLRLPDVTLPAGSRLEFDAEGFIDPARPDVLAGAELASPAHVHGLATPAGTRLRFDPRDGRVTCVEGPLGSPLRVGESAVDGDRPLRFDRAGNLVGCTLAEPLFLGPVTVPAGSERSPWPLPGAAPLVRYRLAGPLALPDVALEAGDAILFDEHGTPAAIDPGRDLPLGGKVLVHGLMTIPLLPDGYVDQAGAARRGLLR